MFFLTVAYLFLPGIMPAQTAHAAGSYTALEEKCGGLPKVAVETIDGTCIGVVLQGDANLKKPRKIARIKNTDAFLLTDMGGWGRNSGSLFLISRGKDGYAAKALLEKLDLPHQITQGPNGKYYLGETYRIVSFELNAKNEIKNMETIVEGLPAEEGNLHPLTHFIFLENNDILANVGAPSDDCRKETGSGKCSTRESYGGLRLYRYIPDTKTWSKDFEFFAKGLRNSMALTLHTSGTVLQAENGMDFPSDDEPYEEINVIERGGDYGWPYCYNNDAANPLWGKDKECKSNAVKRPLTLMPPHSAPLDMMYYKGSAIPALKDKLLVSLHGYRRTGHRIIAYSIDELGRPSLASGNTAYLVDPGGKDKDFIKKPFTPSGTALPVAGYTEITTVWNEAPGLRPKGAPVGLLEADDGSLWIVDDKNKAILRLTSGTPWKSAPNTGNRNIPVAFTENAALSKEALAVMKTRCAECHSFIKDIHRGALSKELSAQGWLTLPVSESKVFDAVHTKRMPPSKPLDAKDLKTMKKWLASLKKK